MRKLTLKDKFILIENQRYIEAKTESEEISIIKLLVWFYKINKIAKKANIDFYAVPAGELHDYGFEYETGKLYHPICRITEGTWYGPERQFGKLRENIDKVRNGSRIVSFLVVPFIEKDPAKEELNKYKTFLFEKISDNTEESFIGETHPGCYYDWQIFKIGSKNEKKIIAR